jgi:hypothetical protein
MNRDVSGRESLLSRHTFLAATGGVLASTAVLGLVGQDEAGKRHPSNSHFEEEHVPHRTSGQIFLGAQASRLLRKRPRWPRSQEAQERSRAATAVVCLADSQN